MSFITQLLFLIKFLFSLSVRLPKFCRLYCQNFRRKRYIHAWGGFFIQSIFGDRNNIF